MGEILRDVVAVAVPMSTEGRHGGREVGRMRGSEFIFNLRVCDAECEFVCMCGVTI